MSSSKFDIVVYGATGFTGQLVAEYLAAHYKADSGLKWAMAGRSKDKLAAVRDAIGAPADTALIVADAGDPASLKAMVDQTKSVISTVGPYQLYGSELVAACVAAGADYFDLCGEPMWMRQMIDAHEAAAKTSGARIVFSCGFDSMPFELGVFCVQEEAKKAFGAPVARVKGRVRNMKGTFSGGTAASMRATFAATMKDLSLVTMVQRSLRTDAGIRRSKTAARQQAAARRGHGPWTAPFVMANINTRNVHRSNMLMGFPYGKDFVYDEMVLTGAGRAGRGQWPRRWWRPTMPSCSGASSVPKPGEGPSKEERENGMLRSAVRRHRARRQAGPRRGQGRPRSRLRLDLEDDLGMRDLPAARCAGRCPLGSGPRVRRWATN